ncbi:MAG: YidC/Oxa1 family insertase periplasmic-domain containing protein [Chitinispirillales bacterium]|jgi:YidC/Oxa1 family membrane protein insertase|nr:YidC/Oxa1 family insertase periplasmic-domain containing protein [Chitinispirillales bacterium]
MKKETLFAFAILLAGFWFFNSKIYYQIIGKPYPYGQTKQTVAQQAEIIPDVPVNTSDKISDVFINESKISDTLDTIETEPKKIITLSNNVLQLQISEVGAKIISAQMLKYKYGKGLVKEGEFVNLISDGDLGILTSTVANFDLSKSGFVYNDSNPSANIAQFDCMLGDEAVSKIFELKENSYYLNFIIRSNLITDGHSISFKSGISESETDDDKSIPYSERVVSVAREKNKTERILMKKIDTYNQTGQFDWMALNSKYFTFVIIPKDKKNRDLSVSSYIVDETAKIEPVNINYDISILQRPQKAVSSENFVEYDVFLGPAKHSDLTQAKVGLERTLFRGYAWFFGANLWFPPLCEGVLWFMNFFGKLFGDYGISIILLTLLLKIVTYPLSQSSINSMAAMQVLQPKIQAIQKKYADNKQLMQQKILELYQSEGINPMASLGGCIPILIQMPIMIALFIVLRKAVELRGEVTFFLPWVQDLSQSEVLFKLPFVIPFYGDNFAFLPILMAGLMFVQNKMTIKDPNQAAMVYMMPIVMLVMFNNFPAGLTLYFTISNLLQILQQKFLTKKPSVIAKNSLNKGKAEKK